MNCGLCTWAWSQCSHLLLGDPRGCQGHLVDPLLVLPLHLLDQRGVAAPGMDPSFSNLQVGGGCGEDTRGMRGRARLGAVRESVLMILLQRCRRRVHGVCAPIPTMPDGAAARAKKPVLRMAVNHERIDQVLRLLDRVREGSHARPPFFLPHAHTESVCQGCGSGGSKCRSP